jgi:hypothetical protein
MHRTKTGILTALVAATMIMGCSEDKSPVQPTQGPQATVITATGDIRTKVADFRTLIGDPANGGTAGQQPAGRREVNWDGAGARPFNNQDDFPANFFNSNVTAGLVYVGNAFRNDSTNFAGINPTYANEFTPFSPKVMFSAIGTNVIDVRFEVAGAATPAAVTGFGVVLADVDLDNTSAIELFDKNGTSLGRFVAPKRSDATGLSFVGAKYDAPIVARVRITCGNGKLGTDQNDLTSGGSADLVVIDNVIYGEPNAL